MTLEPYPNPSGTDYYPSGLTPQSGDPEHVEMMNKVEEALRNFDYRAAVSLAAKCSMGIRARMQAIAEIHRAGAINARREGDGERMIVETTHMRRALDVVGLPYRDPIEEYNERCKNNGHKKMLPLDEGKK